MFTADNPDPGPIFLRPDVQSLLHSITRKDFDRVFRKVRQGQKALHQPIYKFMTDEELQQALSDAENKSQELLQMPPVVAVRKEIDKIISYDPALQGPETSDLVFTDITFGVPNSRRLIVIRQPDGALRHANWSVRTRMNQLYFPSIGRQIHCPKMFEEQNLNDLLKKGEFVFVLDRACTQFEPDEPDYQRVTSMTYDYVNENGFFEKLRSTRHFGPLVFYLCWHKNIDNLLLELVETCRIEDVNSLLRLYEIMHGVELRFAETNDNLRPLQEYISKYSKKAGPLELALQAYKDLEHRNRTIEADIQAAHGN